MTLFFCHCGGVHDSAERDYCPPTFIRVGSPADVARAPGLDLDTVEAAVDAMTPGPWRHVEVSSGGELVRDEVCDAGGNIGGASADFQAANAAGIVTLRNAAPAQLAELRALRAKVTRLDASATETINGMDAQIQALRAKLAEAKRLGLEACDRATHTEQCGKTQADYHHSKGYRGCPGEDEDCTCGLAAIAAALEAL